MTTTEVTSQPTDAERFRHILQAQRAAFLRDGAPSLAAPLRQAYRGSSQPLPSITG